MGTLLDSPSKSQEMASDVVGCDVAGYGETAHSSDPSNITSWVTEHGDDFFCYALLQLRDRDAAEEVVQEAFLGALKNRHCFSGKGSERAWLYSILRNKIVDLRGARARDRKEHSTPDSHDLINASFGEFGYWKSEAIDWRMPDQTISN